ncbi:neurofilament heavy polypeptide [Drosophila takahashii]|uniref:neurofilament heavy polypeptide n=1 Tax=Drosophila takahashii TaxID=29030 RepID=UPI001CF92283|nr:mediator of RNA polymerase II transcription subunit 15 [Drosophila takahashii]
MTKFVVVGLCLLMALGQMASVSGVTEAPEVEQSTESPIADMALIEDVSPMAPKTPTEKPPVVQAPAPSPVAVPLEILEKAANPQPHTVADFIIHPLIAFKPRQASLEEIQGKQAQQGATPAAAGGSPASPGTWLFGMNPAQQLGSSFSTLAGSVSGWFNDRLQAAGQQLPGLVETPVRESTTSTSSTTTTTTQRPDIVVRVQQRPQRNGNRNGGGVGNLNGGGNQNNLNRRRQQRPNRFNNRLDSFEDDYYEDDYFQGNRFDEEFDDDEDEQSLEQFEDEDSLEQVRPQRQKNKKNKVQVTQNQRRKFQQQQEEEQQLVSQKRRQQPLAAQKKPKVQKKPIQPVEEEEEEEENDEDEEENDDEEEDQEQDFQPAAGGSSSTRRSQNQPNFIQRGQQSIISQIRQFTRGQTPGELATTLRRNPATSSSGGSSKTRRPQQTTLLVNRNGQTVYLAPELLSSPYPYAYVQGGQAKKQRVPVSGSFPQPPLTVPVRRQGGGRPTQYITIPWSQLGLSPPDQQSVVSLAEGIQAQPLILNIPQSAISPVRGTSAGGQKKKQRPQLTASAVPLLADASLMDIFQPPQIPPSRTGTPSQGGASAAGGASIKPISAQPVLIAAKPVKAGGLLPTRIRPGTIVEKAPAMEEKQPMEAGASDVVKQEQEMMTPEATQTIPEQQQQQQEFILVGEDDEPGLSRHVQPAFGDARYVSYGDFHPYFDLLTQNRRFALRKSGRSLESPEEHQKEAPRALSTFGKAPEVPKEEVKKEEHQKEEIHKKEEHQKEEEKKEEAHKKEVEKEHQKEEHQKEEQKKEEIHQKEEPHHQEHSA